MVGALLALLVLTFGIVATPAASTGPATSPNISLVQSFAYEAGTDLAFRGRFIYAAQEGNEGGVHVFELVDDLPRPVSFVSCPGTQNDVAVVRPGLIALGFFGGECAGADGAGVRLIDVKNPRLPKLLDAVGFPNGAHTITVFPREPLIYVSPGGLGENGGTEFILDVSDPRNIEVAGEYTPNPFGCHDVSFHVTEGRALGFCPGQAETEIWDVANPLSPGLLATIPPHMEFPHSAIATPDGDVLVVGDESLFTAHECVSGRSPTGAFWAYDISDPATPIPMGQIASPRGASAVGTLATPVCTAHNFNFIPGTRTAVVAWYTGGTSVVDFADPMSPE
ncbi:MAG: LVIVD repeat-containing protein, partial [Actinomycetota bacterium]